jgi:hypothetical protein
MEKKIKYFILNNRIRYNQNIIKNMKNSYKYLYRITDNHSYKKLCKEANKLYNENINLKNIINNLTNKNKELQEIINKNNKLNIK